MNFVHDREYLWDNKDRAQEQVKSYLTLYVFINNTNIFPVTID